MTRPTLVLAAAALALALSPAAASAGLRGFHTPSQNIGCIASTGGGLPTVLRCDIASKRWQAPARPARCDLDYGDSLGLTATGSSQFGCHGDTALHQGPGLAYGSTWRYGPFTCTSRATGLTCRNRAGHGFALSRERLRRF